MDAATFRAQLLPYLDDFRQVLATEAGDWVVKGFIDVHHNIYTISVDTKVISKIMELMLFPVVVRFAREQGYQLFLSLHQNHYPDVTFVATDGTKFALDFKSTYRVTPALISGFTLGAFTGYFRQRSSNKNVLYPYQSYAAHFVLGVIYTRTDHVIDERKIYKLEALTDIQSVVRDFTFLLHEKWRIASDKPGSGNTKNIGSTRNIKVLLEGLGTFSQHGEAIFDDYWMHYLTDDMARAIDSVVLYRNLREYLEWRNRHP